MPALILAQPTSDNSVSGAYFTLWFPLGLFIIVGIILWLLYTRPHHRVPPRRPAHAAAAAGTQGVGTATGWGHDEAPAAGTGHAQAGQGTTGAGPARGAGPAPGAPPGGVKPPDDDEGRIV